LDSMKILTTYMGETTGSKFDRDKDYPDWSFRDIPSVLQASEVVVL
jgi:hypothetical protein